MFYIEDNYVKILLSCYLLIKLIRIIRLSYFAEKILLGIKTAYRMEDEILKLTERFKDNWLMKMIATPGLWVQKMTTKEPSKKQVDVAVKALKSVLD